MKKILMVLAMGLSLIVGLNAQGFGGPGMGNDITWGEGTSMLAEYKKLSGTILIGERLNPVFKVGNVEYVLHIPRQSSALASLKNGDSITLEGIVHTLTNADKSKVLSISPFKAVIAGKEIVLIDPSKQNGMNHRAGRGNGPGMGQGRR